MKKYLVILFASLFSLVGLAEWNSKEEAEQNCISASRYGIKEKCYVCKGCGYLKQYKYGKPIPGRLRRGPRLECYVQCNFCLKKKDKWEKLKLEQKRKEILARRAFELEVAEEKKQWNEEQERKRARLAAEKKRLDDAAENVRKAKMDLELAELVAENAFPEKLCEIHKWKEYYAPRFGGDYYTTDAKAKYAQNYMKALELQEKGLLKCMCYDSNLKQNWLDAQSKVNETKKKLEEAIKQQKEVINNSDI